MAASCHPHILALAAAREGVISIPVGRRDAQGLKLASDIPYLPNSFGHLSGYRLGL
jgi:hypothetical protein